MRKLPMVEDEVDRIDSIFFFGSRAQQRAVYPSTVTLTPGFDVIGISIGRISRRAFRIQSNVRKALSFFDLSL